jgi:hypothetical protein
MSALYEAIHAVMNRVGYVQKTGQVSGGQVRYRFASEVDLLQALRPAMVEAGLMLLPVGCVVQQEMDRVEKSGRDGKPYIVTTVRARSTVAYRLAHVSGEYVDLQVCGEGQDSGDKSTPKAMTIALKYALRQAFLIETGDDPDESASPVQSPPPPPPPAPKSALPEWRRDLDAALRDAGAKSAADADALIRCVTDQGDGSCSVTSLAQARADEATAGLVLAGLRDALGGLSREALMDSANQYRR